MHYLRFHVFLTALLGSYATAAIPVSATEFQPVSLRVGEGFVDPIGFHDPSPVFSWKLPVMDGVLSQSAYQIVVTSEPSSVSDTTVLWDSGWVESEQSVLVPYGGEPLQSRQRIEWRVRFRDQDGKESAWSKTAMFELGLLTAKDWQAKWIRPVDASTSTFKLIKAIYRSKTNHDRNKDVTALLQKRIQDNLLSVTASNAALGGDPAQREVKELVITYQLDGEEKTDTLDENKEGVFPASADTGERVAWLRRTSPLAGKIARARLYVTARGVFEIRLNGKHIGNEHFANGWTSYDHRLDTLTYDVTDQLQDGDNSIAALLGTGWYAGRIGWKHQKSVYGRHPELLLQLEINYKDGRTETIVSDEKWEATFDGPILFSSLYDGEHYDARERVSGWQPVVVNPRYRLRPTRAEAVCAGACNGNTDCSEHHRAGAWASCFRPRSEHGGLGEAQDPGRKK